ncbi:MAG: glycosyltransferase family 2 protein [Helicobacteraceae bacterium]|nr:glycosyltransferase family 2 protein [Helicobacteraceae bacterium]
MHRSCIVIPVYNNPTTIEEVVYAALKTKSTVIVVDDGSEPGVVLNIDEDEALYLLRHSLNKGKGEAILTGGKMARELGFDSFFIVDGDGQHFPHEINNFIGKDLEKCIVIGCRRFAENVPNSSKFGRKFSNFWIWTETGLRLDDTQSGFRSYPVRVLDLPIEKRRYDFEIEVLVRHVWNGGCIEEVGIEVYYPKPEDRVSHFNALKDNVRLSNLHARLFFINMLRLIGIR